MEAQIPSSPLLPGSTLEQAVREAEERYRIFSELTSDYTHVLRFAEDGGAIMESASEAFVHRFGYSVEELRQRGWSVVIHPDSLATSASVLERLRAGERVVTEFKAVTRSGEVRWVHYFAAPRRGPDGEVDGFYGAAQDITERKLSERRLRASEEKYRTLFENLDEGAFLTDANGRPVDVNPALVELLGYESADELSAAGRFIDCVASADDRDVVVDELATHGVLRDFEIGLRRKDGSVVHCVISLSAMDGLGAKGRVCGTVRDVSTERELETQLRQAQRLEAVGRLAGGVAHDFNNLLLVVRFSARIASTELPDDHAAQASLREIETTAERATELSRQLLAFARRGVSAPEALDLNQVVTSIEPMIRRLIGEHIRIVTSLDPWLGRVRADRAQFEQVLVNLAVNARDAMVAGGELHFVTSNFDDPSNPPGGSVSLAVRDTGCGMSDDVKKHLFEPFFTTKEVGEGSGLGLATCYGIVKQAGGRIEVESHLAEGTVIRILLPRVADVDEPRAEPPTDERRRRRSSGTILVVEDDEGVRRVVSRILRAEGYRILEAASGREAIALVEAADAPRIDLLLTDVVMPESRGSDVARALRSRIPGLALLFMSGYPADEALRQGIEDGDAEFVQKPFTPEQLTGRIASILDRP